jgi:hypothetical protein
MSILPTNGIRTDALRAATSRRQTGFSVAEQSARLSETSAPAAAATDPLLFLQEVESPQERDARSRRHGTALLDLLTKLQQGLLDGAAAADVLVKLQTLSGQLTVAANPRLQEAVAAITLRAHVEIARGEKITKENNLNRMVLDSQTVLPR